MRTIPFAPLNSLFSSTDEQAMWRVQTRDDEEAFAQLVRRWEGPIQRLCIRITGDPHRGEDLAQETFARVFAQRKGWQPSGKFSTWLWRIALNLCYDELRRLKRRPESSLDNESGAAFAEAFAAPDPPPDKSLLERERGEQVRQALMRLSETYRTVLVMRHYEDLKFREIAEVLEIPEGTVKSRMAEALMQMSRMLRPMMAAEPKPGQRTERELPSANEPGHEPPLTGPSASAAPRRDGSAIPSLPVEGKARDERWARTFRGRKRAKNFWNSLSSQADGCALSSEECEGRA
jgi:RNA polymerase sigma-70 factor (ECF subfamily)